MRIFLAMIVSILVALPAYGQATRKGTLTARAAVAGTALETAGTTYTEALSIASLVQIDIVNETDCAIEARLDNATNTPAVIVPAGTYKEIDLGDFGFYSNTAVSVRQVTGETCTSESVYVQGMIADATP